MVDQLNAFAGEVTRVAREVGTDGRLGGQANVLGVAGTWKDLTDSVNSMASNLTAQVRNIAEVSTAMANGDLSKKITVDVKGEILQLKETINTTVDQLNAFASEVTRVAREVGTEGKLGGQATGARRGRHLEGLDRLRELDGLQPHRPGPQHRRSGHRRGAGRLVEEDHRERVGRNPSAEGNHQHHGGPAQRLRRRSDARGARGGYRRQARRSGRSARRGRHLEGLDQLGELDGRQPDGTGAQHRRGGDRHRRRRLVTQDHRGRARRDPSAEGNPQHHGGPAQPLRRRSDARGARSGHRRPPRRSGQRAGRRRHLEGPHRLGELDGRQPDGAGA